MTGHGRSITSEEMTAEYREVARAQDLIHHGSETAGTRPREGVRRKPAPLKIKGCGTQRLRVLRMSHPAITHDKTKPKSPTFARSGRTWGTPKPCGLRSGEAE